MKCCQSEKLGFAIISNSDANVHSTFNSKLMESGEHHLVPYNSFLLSCLFDFSTDTLHRCHFSLDGTAAELGLSMRH